MRTRRSFDLGRWLLLVWLVLALSCAVLGQKDKSEPSKADATGQYEGTAKNNDGEVITVALDLTEKDGAMSGTIKSSHGDFTITGGSHHGDEVKLEFDANGGPGSITMHPKEDGWVGTWSAGDDGGPVEVKKAVVQRKESPLEYKCPVNSKGNLSNKRRSRLSSRPIR